MSEELYKNNIRNSGSDDESGTRQDCNDADISVIIQQLSDIDDVSNLDLPLIWKPLQNRIHSLSMNLGELSVQNTASCFPIQNCTYPLAIQSQNGIEASNSAFQKLFGRDGGDETISVPPFCCSEHQRDIYAASDGSEWVISRFPLFDGNNASLLLALTPKDTVPDSGDMVFSAIPDPALILNKNGIIIKANPAFLTISGKKIGELLYHDLTSVYLDEDLGPQVKTVLSARIPYTTSIRYTGADGVTVQRKVFLAPLSVIPDQVDQVLLILNNEDPLPEDITHDTRNEYNTLKERYINLVSHLPLAFADIDGSGKVSKVNNDFAEILGVPSDSLLFKQMNMLVPDLIYETNPDQLFHGKNCIIRDGPLFSPGYHGTIEIQAIRKPDGHESDKGMFLFLIKKPLKTESLEIPSQNEPTEKREEIFHLLLRNTSVPMALIQADGSLSYMNESLRSLIGLDPRDNTTISAQECGFIPVSVSDLKKTLETGTTWCNLAYCNATGKEVQVNVTYIPLSPEMAPVYGIVIVFPSKDNKTCIQQPDIPCHPEFSLSDQMENWLNQFIASYPEPALICSHDGFIRFVNHVFADRIGVHVDTIKGLRLQDFVNRPEKEEFSFSRSDMSSNIQKVRILGKEKNRFFYQYSIPVPSSDQKQDIILYFDITQEIDILRTLSDETKMLHGTVASLNDKIASTHLTSEAVVENEICSDTGSCEILEFTIQDSWFAIDVEMVKEIVEMVTITPLPKTPSYICGVINLRGEIVTIIDLSKLIGSTSQKKREEQKIIVLSSEKTERVNLGLIVDEVNSVQLVEKGQLNKLGDDITAHTSTGIKSIIRLSTDDRDSVESVEGATRLIIWLKMENIIDEIRLHS